MLNDIFFQIKTGGAYMKIIAINIAVFVIINLTSLVMFLFNTSQALNYEFLNLLAAPASFMGLISKPWTLFTYMFTHKDLFHLVVNLIMFVFAGRLFEETLGQFKLILNYVVGGVFGALFFMMCYAIFPVFANQISNSIIIGASASILALLVAVTVYYPNMQISLFFIGQVKLKYITLIFFVIDLLSIDKSNPGGHLSHIGGAIWGFLYAIQLQKGRDLLSWLAVLENKKVFNSKPFLSIVTNKEKKSEPPQAKSKQSQMDELLDKISKSGYDSLSKTEKDTLYKLSQDQSLNK